MARHEKQELIPPSNSTFQHIMVLLSYPSMHQLPATIVDVLGQTVRTFALVPALSGPTAVETTQICIEPSADIECGLTLSISGKVRSIRFAASASASG